MKYYWRRHTHGWNCHRSRKETDRLALVARDVGGDWLGYVAIRFVFNRSGRSQCDLRFFTGLAPAKQWVEDRLNEGTP